MLDYSSSARQRSFGFLSTGRTGRVRREVADLHVERRGTAAVSNTLRANPLEDAFELRLVNFEGVVMALEVFTWRRREFLTEYRFDPNQFSTMHRARIKKKWDNAHATCKRRRDFSEPTIIVGMGEIDPEAGHRS
jgi:hypothetical protein